MAKRDRNGIPELHIFRGFNADPLLNKCTEMKEAYKSFQGQAVTEMCFNMEKNAEN
jgi:hypothetical protein